ncbi:hypothetical protein D3C72_2551790 [compost metagenome]
MAISVEAIGMGIEAIRSAGLASVTVRFSWSMMVIGSASAGMAVVPATSVVMARRRAKGIFDIVGMPF